MASGRITFENIKFAVYALRTNRLRTLLSISGITIGIFSVILVLTIVNSLEKNIRDSVNELGSDVIYIEKWPWAPEEGKEYEWWEYMKRPQPKLTDLGEMQRALSGSRFVKQLAFFTTENVKSVKYSGSSLEGVTMFGVSYEYESINHFNIGEGRYFTEEECRSGRNVVILGSTISSNLFGTADPIGKMVSMDGKKLLVIGVVEKQGESMIGFSLDNMLLVPVQFIMSYKNVNRNSGDMALLAKAEDGVLLEDMEHELRGRYRAIRKLKPREPDNFALNKITVITESLGNVFSSITVGGWVIGSFALLVGGFGIYNIMYVGVKERTGQIGIQKSLGAKRAHILVQFLTEAIILCALGGLLGIFLVYLCAFLATSAFGFAIALSLKNFIIGTGLSVLIGFLSGLIPAWIAATLDPVEAIRSKI